MENIKETNELNESTEIINEVIQFDETVDVVEAVELKPIQVMDKSISNQLM